MHILIGLITAIAGLIWALYRLQNSGVDLNAFNPFYWMRRRQWQQQLSVKPLHAVQNPMEAAAVLIVGMAEMEGRVTVELKQLILDAFVTEFGIDSAQAAELFAASSHLLKDAADLSLESKYILAPSMDKYESRHVESLLSMLEKAGTYQTRFSDKQKTLYESVRALFQTSESHQSRW